MNGVRPLGRFVEGDPDAFVAFYRLNLRSIVAFLLHRTGDREVTADLAAEVFAGALTAAPRYDPAAGPALAWLYGIASHKLADSRRRGRVEDEARRRLALDPLVLDDEALGRYCIGRRCIGWLPRPVYVATMFDAQDDHFALVLVDSVEHAVGTTAS